MRPFDEPTESVLNAPQRGRVTSADSDRSGGAAPPRAQDAWRLAVHNVQESLGLDHGAELEGAARKFGESCEAVRHGCEQILLTAISPERLPGSWDDLEHMVLRWERGFWIGFIKLVCSHIRDRRSQPFPLATKRSSDQGKSPIAEQSCVVDSDQNLDAWASAAVARFESALHETPHVEKHERTYPTSDYAALMEAIIIAYLSEDAFARRRWPLDVHASLLRWLPKELCQRLFEGGEEAAGAFRNALKKCAQQHYEDGTLARQFLDIEVGIRQLDLSPRGGLAFS